MLKTSEVTNTWACDSCETEQVSANDPFYSVTISVLSKTNFLQIDLCEICIGLIPTQSIIDYVTG